MVEEGENVVSMGHAGKNGVPPGVGGDIRNIVGDAIENFSVACSPKMPCDHRFDHIACSIKLEACKCVEAFNVERTWWNFRRESSRGREVVQSKCMSSV